MQPPKAGITARLMTRLFGRSVAPSVAAAHNSPRMREWIQAAILLGVALTAPAPSQAGTAPPTVYCVSNVTQLQNALAAIRTTQGSFDLRIRSGYYPLTPPGGGNFNYGMRVEKIFRPNDGQLGFNRISGTWNEGCQQRAAVINGSTSTLIDGQGLTGNLLVTSDSFPVGDQPTEILDLVIERIQFANGNAGNGETCVQVVPRGTLFYRLNVTVDRLRIELCEGTALNSQAGASVVVRNSIFLGNSDQTTPGMSISADDSEGTASIYNNTFRFNRMGALNSPGTIRVRGGIVRVFNNLFADTDYGGANVPADVRIWDASATARNNRLGAAILHSGTGGVIQLNNTQMVPGFANASGPQLAPSSPLRDLGTSPAPSPGLGDVDFTGNPRVQGVAVDIGAFELTPLALPDAVFANGFEGP